MDTKRMRGFGFNDRGKFFVFLCIGFLVTALIAAEAGAADLAGSKDHPLVKRFGGSEIGG